MSPITSFPGWGNLRSPTGNYFWLKDGTLGGFFMNKNVCEGLLWEGLLFSYAARNGVTGSWRWLSIYSRMAFASDSFKSLKNTAISNLPFASLASSTLTTTPLQCNCLVTVLSCVRLTGNKSKRVTLDINSILLST